MDVKLIIIGGKANKSRVAVKLPTVIGRSRDADLTVAHPMISRKHCELHEVNGLVMVRDLGSLNGLFVGGRQVNEAALHPNAEFTVGPLTFRVEYQYAGQPAVEPDATTINEPYVPPIAASGPAAGDFEVADQPAPIAEAPGASAEEPAPTAEEEPAIGEGLAGPPDVVATIAPPDVVATIAPPDGQLPDFSAWGVEETEQQPAEEPLAPPPTLFAEEAPLQNAAPEIDEGPTPEAEVSAAPEPTASLPETAAFEPGELAELRPAAQPAADVAEGGQPPEGSGVEPADSGAPATQSSTGAADEETGEATVGPAPQPDETPEEGMFDFDLPPAPQPDDPGEAGTGDEALDDFLKGLE